MRGGGEERSGCSSMKRTAVELGLGGREEEMRSL